MVVMVSNEHVSSTQHTSDAGLTFWSLTVALNSQQTLLFSRIALKFNIVFIHWIHGCYVAEALPVWGVCVCQRQIDRTGTRIVASHRTADALHLVTPAIICGSAYKLSTPVAKGCSASSQASTDPWPAAVLHK